MAKKKLESNFINMVVILTTIALISAGTLSFIYDITKGPIEEAKKQKKLKAITEVVLKGYDNKPAEEMYILKDESGVDLECYPAKTDGKLTSVAIKTYTKKGFSGEIWLMVGLKADGSINKISVIDQKETPGLGTKIMADKFKSQFENKFPNKSKLMVTKDGGEIDAITAATISSRAFCDAVDRAYKTYRNDKSMEEKL